MKTYKQTFEKLEHSALIPFFVIGDPDYGNSLKIVKSAIDAGADILEMGIPFSDPIADGPTIQKADIRALDAGMTVAKAKEFISEVKAYKDIPIGLLLYYNLVCKYGVEEFLSDFHEAGVNSVLIADLCIDDAEEILPAVEKSGMETVFMVTPLTPEQRTRKIAQACSGFIYTVSVLGVTGSRDSLSGAVGPLIKRLKAITDVPVCVGFGVSKAEHAVELARSGADGVIIGSRIVRIIEENIDNPERAAAEVGEFVRDVKKSLSEI
jgi:tryptophan synthase alpha chain